MKRITLLAVVFFLIGFGETIGQNLSDPNSIHLDEKESQIERAPEGTFQFIRTSKVEEAISFEMLSLIEAKRDETDNVYYRLSDNLTVKILSKEEINRVGFQPLDGLYIEEEIEEGAGNE